LKVVLDANVLVSAAISPAGVPAQIVREWLAGGFDIVISPKLLAEVERGLRGRTLGGRVPPERVDEIIDQLRSNALVVEDPTELERVVEADPEDDFVNAIARSAEASVIVTGDRHVLEIDDFQPPAITPRRFLVVLQSHSR